jgi:undecaprenyl-diphosphatase
MMHHRYLTPALSLPVIILLVVAGNYVYDQPVAAVFSGAAGPVVWFFQKVTYLGDSTWSLVGSGLLFFYYFYGVRKRQQASCLAYIFCSIAFSGIVTSIIKWFMGRWRPNVYIPEGLYGFQFFGAGYEQTSFPSGHATTICALAFALTVLFPRYRWAWGLVAILVCMSRIVIGAHYTSDVIMGAYIGIFIAFLLRKVPLFGTSIKEDAST